MNKKKQSNKIEVEDNKIEENENNPNEENKKSEINMKLLQELDDLCTLKHQLDLSHAKINEKAINKILKERPFIVPVLFKKPKTEESINKSKESNESKEPKEGDGFNCCQLYMFPSGITKRTYKNFSTGEEKEEIVDYSCLDPKVYEKFKKNPTRELDILIGNSGYLFNKSQIMISIVKKKISGYYLWDRLYIWKHYIKSLDDTEKIKLIRNFLYRLKLFFKKCYEELIKIDKIKYADTLLRNKLGNEYNEKDWNEFYLSSKMLGYNPDGSLQKDYEKEEKNNLCVLMEDKIKLNIKSELNGTGAGLIFIKELRNFSNMFLYMKSIFEKVFVDCFDLLSSDFDDNFIKWHCVIFKYFDQYILSNSFVVKMFNQLLIIYTTYKQYELVNYLHKLLIPKFNAFDELEKIENSISKRIGNDNEFDEEKKIEKMKDIDELINYIQSDKKQKKKKKKKKNEDDPINQLEKLYHAKNFGDEDYEDIYEGKEIPDNISVMSGVSEADSIVKAFKSDVKSYNFSGEKLKANLSDNFIYNLGE